MTFWKRLFGGNDEPTAPPPQADRRATSPRAKRDASPPDRVHTPASIGNAFARRVNGRFEDLSVRVNQGPSSALARVSFEHAGAAVRLVFYQYDATTVNAWLETRAVGKGGAFALTLWDGDAELEAFDEDDDEPRTREWPLFLTERAYVESEDPGPEAARIMDLAPDDRTRLYAMLDHADAVTLGGEVLSANLGEILEFAECVAESPEKHAVVIASLVHIARVLPEAKDEESAKRRARRCRYCDAIFLFSTLQTTCARCGAPPAQAHAEDSFREPPRKVRTESFMNLVARMVAEAREPAERFAKHVPLATLVEHGDRGWVDAAVSVSFREAGYDVRVDYRATDVALIVELPGVEGHFALCHADDYDIAAPPSDGWTVNDRPRYVSERCYFDGDDSPLELARFETLPAASRSALCAYCEKHRAIVTLETKNETRSGVPELQCLLPNNTAREESAEMVVALRELTAIAAALPPVFSRGRLAKTATCAHCGAESHLDETARCKHCGASLRAAT